MPDSTRAVAIVQARMGSSRLPGKVLERVCGQTLLEHEMDRILRARSLAEVVVATSVSAADDAIEETVRSRGWPVWRGSEVDVLGRYAGAAVAFGADPVVRITMDCPLIDPTVIDSLVRAFGDGTWDLVANNLERTFPHGLDLEVMSRSALLVAHREASRAFDREHVTPFIRDRPERFRLNNIRCSRDLHHLRWTVDYPEDLEFVRLVYETLYPENHLFSTNDVLALLEERPEIAAVNASRIEP